MLANRVPSPIDDDNFSLDLPEGDDRMRPSGDSASACGLTPGVPHTRAGRSAWRHLIDVRRYGASSTRSTDAFESPEIRDSARGCLPLVSTCRWPIATETTRCRQGISTSN